MAELGLPAMTAAIWFGYPRPGQTPAAVIDKLARPFAAPIRCRPVKRVSELGAELTLSGPAGFGKIIDEDRSRYGKIVADSNLATQN